MSSMPPPLMTACASAYCEDGALSSLGGAVSRGAADCYLLAAHQLPGHPAIEDANREHLLGIAILGASNQGVQTLRNE